ncbi:5739_t:CDS:2 [Entrophospora sp. SA101]|nr:5739_t:CDS:2 [Entrophospora sp. SA101]
MTQDDAKTKRVNQALTWWFICSGIPFVAVDSPFFFEFTKSLCYGYNPPYRSTLFESRLNLEIANITQNFTIYMPLSFYYQIKGNNWGISSKNRV